MHSATHQGYHNVLNVDKARCMKHSLFVFSFVPLCMDEVIIKCDDNCVITMASVDDVPKFVTLIRPIENAKHDAKPEEKQSNDWHNSR